MSIGEFARSVGLSVSAVRFYDDRGLLAPAETDPKTGYRYYTEQQLPRGLTIRNLRRMELSLVDIAAILEMTPGDQDAAIHNHLSHFEDRLNDARNVALEFAATTTEPVSATTTVGAKELARSIRQVIPAAGRNLRQPHYMCVLLEVRDNSLRCVATDSHRLAIRDLVPSAIGPTFSAVVAAAEIRSWPEALALDTPVELAVVDAMLTASTSELDLNCAVIPVEFPDYESVLGSSDGLSTSITVDRRDLSEMLRFFGGDDPMMLSPSRDELVASSGGVVRRIAANVVGADLHAAVNPRFVADAVEQAVGEEVIIESDGGLGPLTFRSADDGTYTSMLMPVRLA